MTDEQILLRAIERIKKGWTQRTYARDTIDDGVGSDYKDAVAWCILGSIGSDVDDRSQLQTLLESQLKGHWKAASLPSWNDDESRRKSHVLALLNEALVRVRAAKKKPAKAPRQPRQDR